MKNADQNDAARLREVLDLAERGVGLSAPNPTVGCIVVTESGEVVGRGFHRYADRDHAEVVALREAGERARGATVYVSLEPCSSHGRTPPCTDALIAAGVGRVVAACTDPDPRHRGASHERLAAAGIEMSHGSEEIARRALALNEHFICWRLTGRPFVTLKAASSLDGRTAAAGGESRWITGTEARASAHQARRAHAAILCGVGTVLADDPALTVRLPEVTGVEPLRIVLDPSLRTPPTAKLLDGDGGPVLIATSEAAVASERGDHLRAKGAELLALPRHKDALSLGTLLDELGQRRSINGLLVEGGGITTGHFLDQGLGDELLLYLAPLVLGGGGGQAAAFSGFAAQTLADGKRLSDLRWRLVGQDLELRGRLPGGFRVTAEA